MAALTTAEVARLLREMGRRLALAGGNPYRAKAYLRAAENLALTTLPLEQLIARDRLREIPGIGEALAGVIRQLHATGRYPKLDALREQAPESLLEMLDVPGLMPDRIRKLHAALGISSLAALEQAAQTGRLAGAKGFGPAFQAKVLQGIAMSRRPAGRHLHRAAAAIAQAAAELGRTHPRLQHVTPSGDFRRGCELVGTLSLVAVDPAGPSNDSEIRAAGDLVVTVTSPDRYGIALLLATGSEKHVEALRGHAAARGFVLARDGLHDGTRILASATEAAIYGALDLPFIAPELRETGREVELARRGQLVELVGDGDIRGVLHVHTDRSDGADTLAAMADAARARGFAYLGLTDHSRTAAYAGGLTIEQVRAQAREADALNRRSDGAFRIFKGIESDILADGALDYPDEVLDRFELVIASVHSRFGLGKAEQTERILKAIANPHTTILGHVTGRQLLRRPGYELDMEAVLEACARENVAIEINANPWRLDMDWRWCARALELGCLFSINADAHSTEEIDNTRWGVVMARKGAVPADRVINAFVPRDFTAWLEARRPDRGVRGSTRHAGAARRSRRNASSRSKAPARSAKPRPRPAGAGSSGA